MAFGFAGLPQPQSMSPEDLARLFNPAAMGAPQGFTGTSGTIVEPGENAGAPLALRVPPGGQDAGPTPMTVPLPPQRPSADDLMVRGQPQVTASPSRPPPLGPMPSPEPAPKADLPAPGSMPLQGQMPAPVAAAASSAPASATPSFGGGLLSGLRDHGDMLGALGMGLLSRRGFGQGLGAGMQLAQAQEGKRAATDLARAELGLKQRKLAQETSRENQTAKVIATKLGIPLDQATAFAGNPEFVNGFLKNNYGTPDGYARGADGVLAPIPGGPQDTATLKARAQAQAEGAAAGGKDDVQIVSRPDGSIIAVNKSQLGEPGAAGAVTPVAPGASKLAADGEQRKQLVIAQGHDPNDPRYADFIVSGSLPKESQQKVTETDKKAILEADEKVAIAKNTIGQLRNALDLSKKAYSGPLASQRGYVTSLFGNEAGVATQDLDNQVKGQALENLKAIFGGNPTEGERAILLQLQGSSSQVPEVRDQIYRRAIAAAERRLAFSEGRAGELRGGTYYKPKSADGAATAADGAPPSPPSNRLRFDPTTGAFR